MKYFVLAIFCNLLSSGHLKEINNGNDYNLIQGNAFHTIQSNSNSQVQDNVIPKPCTRRSNSESEHLEQSWDPPSTPKAILPSINYHSVNTKQEPINNQLFFPNPPLIDSNHIYQNKDSFLLSNPTIDSEIEISTPKIQEQKKSDSSSRRNLESDSKNKFKFISNNEFERGPENEYISDPRNVVDSEPKNDYISAPLNVIDSDLNADYKTLPTSLFRSLQTTEAFDADKQSRRVSPTTATINSQTTSENKCFNTEDPNTRRSMSTYAGEPNGNIFSSDDNDFDLKNNAPYIETHYESQNPNRLFANVNERLSKDKNLSKLYEKTSSTPNTEKPVTRISKAQLNEARREMLEPTTGSGVTSMGRSGLTLMQSERVCYACSTANNPTCWAPDRRTTVKYCKKGNNACITKTFGSGSTFTLIRDCGKSCDDSEMGGLMPKYKSCSMCHSELCNGAFSINGQSIMFALLLTTLVKYMN